MKFKNLKLLEFFLTACVMLTLPGCLFRFTSENSTSQSQIEEDSFPDSSEIQNVVGDSPSSSSSQNQGTKEFNQKSEADVMTEKLIGCLELTDEEKKSIFDLSEKVLSLGNVKRQSDSDFVQLTNSINELLNKYTEEKIVPNVLNIETIKKQFEKYKELNKENIPHLEITQSTTYDIVDGQEIVKNSDFEKSEEVEFEKAAEQAWEEIKKIFPPSILSNIKYYNPFSTPKLEEGSATYGGYISMDQDGNYVIAVNVSLGMETIPYTFYHEYGHYISLNSGEFIEPTSMNDCVLKNYYDLKFKEDAYLKNFFDKFYKYTYDDMIAGENPYYFFLRHNKEFVSVYASTSLLEDFAESFACFMIGHEDDKGTEKVKFFENYPELVDLKESCAQLREVNGVTARKLT